MEVTPLTAGESAMATLRWARMRTRYRVPPRWAARLVLTTANRVVDWLWEHEYETEADALDQWSGARHYRWLGPARPLTWGRYLRLRAYLLAASRCPHEHRESNPDVGFWRERCIDCKTVTRVERTT